MADPNPVDDSDANADLPELPKSDSADESILITRPDLPTARATPNPPTARPPTTAELLESARRLRAVGGAGQDELRRWVDEGRA